MSARDGETHRVDVAWDAETQRADVVILTALRLELEAVLAIDAGAVPGRCGSLRQARADCRWRFDPSSSKAGARYALPRRWHPTFCHDTGKQRAGGVQQDLTTYNLRDDWKTALEGLDVVAHSGAHREGRDADPLGPRS